MVVIHTSVAMLLVWQQKLYKYAGYYKPCNSLCNISGNRQLQSVSSSGLSYDVERRLFLQFLLGSVFSDVINVQHLQ
jgi:hypothetical protein